MALKSQCQYSLVSLLSVNLFANLIVDQYMHLASTHPVAISSTCNVLCEKRNETGGREIQVKI